MSDESSQKRRAGRPRKFTNGTTTNITVSIEKRQREWLDELTLTNPNESVSRIVRDALDLWYQVHEERQNAASITYAVTSTDKDNPAGADRSDDDTYDWL